MLCLPLPPVVVFEKYQWKVSIDNLLHTPPPLITFGHIDPAQVFFNYVAADAKSFPDSDDFSAPPVHTSNTSSLRCAVKPAGHMGTYLSPYQ